MLGHRIYGKRLGIIGMGRIGQAVAQRAKALRPVRSTITTASASPAEIEEELEATYWESLDQMLMRMDIVSVNCPHTPGDLSPAVGAPAQASCGRTAYIVNTARGEVIDENELGAPYRGGLYRGRRASTCSSTSRR